MRIGRIEEMQIDLQGSTQLTARVDSNARPPPPTVAWPARSILAGHRRTKTVSDLPDRAWPTLVRTSFDSNDTPIEVYMVVLPGNKHVLLYDVDAS